MYLGAHVSTSGGVDKAPANGRDLGCQAIQVFTRNQMQWRARPLAQKEVAAFQQETPHEIRAGEVLMARDRDQGTLQLKRHVLEKARLAAAGRPRGRSVAKVARGICR